MIKVVIPTRGLIFSRTLSSLQTNHIKLDDIVIVENQPLPDCHELGVKRALQDSPTHILMVEDDIEIPVGGVEKMVKINKPIVCIDYPMDNGYSTVCRKQSEIWWCGLGCTLINASIFRHIDKPWFDTSYSWKFLDAGSDELKLTKEPIPYKYGGADINFCMKARNYGYTIAQVPDIEAEHYRCDQLIKSKYNQGGYQIKELEPISKHQQYI